MANVGLPNLAALDDHMSVCAIGVLVSESFKLSKLRKQLCLLNSWSAGTDTCQEAKGGVYPQGSEDGTY